LKLQEIIGWGLAGIYKEFIKVRRPLCWNRIYEQLKRICMMSQMARVIWRVQRGIHLVWGVWTSVREVKYIQNKGRRKRIYFRMIVLIVKPWERRIGSHNISVPSRKMGVGLLSGWAIIYHYYFLILDTSQTRILR